MMELKDFKIGAKVRLSDTSKSYGVILGVLKPGPYTGAAETYVIGYDENNKSEGCVGIWERADLKEDNFKAILPDIPYTELVKTYTRLYTLTSNYDVVPAENKELLETPKTAGDAKYGTEITVDGVKGTVIGEDNAQVLLVSNDESCKMAGWDIIKGAAWSDYTPFTEDYVVSRFKYGKWKNKSLPIDNSATESKTEMTQKRTDKVKIAAIKLGTIIKHDIYGIGTVVAKNKELFLVAYKDQQSHSPWPIEDLQDRSAFKADFDKCHEKLTYEEISKDYKYGWWINNDNYIDIEILEEPKETTKEVAEEPEKKLTLKDISLGDTVKTKDWGTGTVVLKGKDDFLLAFNDQEKHNHWEISSSVVFRPEDEALFSSEELASRFKYGWWVSDSEEFDIVKPKKMKIEDVEIGSVVKEADGNIGTVVAKGGKDIYLIAYKEQPLGALPRWKVSEVEDTYEPDFDVCAEKYNADDIIKDFKVAWWFSNGCELEVISGPPNKIEKEEKCSQPQQPIKDVKLGSIVKSKVYGAGTIVGVHNNGNILLAYTSENDYEKGGWYMNNLPKSTLKDCPSLLYDTIEQLSEKFVKGIWLASNELVDVIKDPKEEIKEETKVEVKKADVKPLNEYDLGSVVVIDDEKWEGEYTILAIHSSGEVLLGFNHDKNFPVSQENRSHSFYEHQSSLLDKPEELKKAYKKTAWVYSSLTGSLISEPSTMKEEGTAKLWYNKYGKLHRIGAPAIEHSNGNKEWYVNGKRHRIDGPAIEWNNGDESWYLNGQVHREDGPAHNWKNDKKWLYKGIETGCKSQEEFEKWKIDNGYGTKAASDNEVKDIANTTQDILKEVVKKLGEIKIEAIENKAITSIPMTVWLGLDVDVPEKEKIKDSKDSEIIQSAYRIASHQIIKGVKASILSLMKQAGQNNSQLNAISDMLDTEWGTAFVSVIVGYSLTHSSMCASVRARKLAEEFRISGLTTAGNQAFSSIMDAIVPIISKAISDIPKEQVRIGDLEAPMEEPENEAKKELGASE